MSQIIRSEVRRYLHDRTFWIAIVIVFVANAAVLTGGHQLESPGRDVLGRIMMKSIATIMIIGVYAGLSFGGDFERRTFAYPIRCGCSKRLTFISKACVFIFFMSFAMMLFPFCAVVGCTITNGWGAPIDLKEVVLFLIEILSLLVLSASIAMVSVLVSVVTQSSTAAIAVSIGLTLVQVPLLNGSNALIAAHVLPFGAIWFIAKGSMGSFYGMVLGITWMILLIAISLLVLERTDMK